MAVPNRPTSGAPIETAWGDVVHDTIVANDMQAGTAVVPANVGTVNVVFPRPFAAPPAVAIAILSNSRGFSASAGAVTANGFTIVTGTITTAPAVPTAALTVSWIAAGARA